MRRTTRSSQKTTETDVNAKIWVMCPVCHEANSPDNMFCRHCYANRITKLEPEPLRSLAEIEQIRTEWLSRRRIRKIIRRTVIAVVSALALTAIVIGILFYSTDLIAGPRPSINSESAAGEWAMFGYNLERAGSAGLNAAVPEGTLKWVFTTGRDIESSPVVVDGVVYIGSTDSNFYAIDARTGEERWRFTAESWIESSAVVAGGTVYVGSNDGNLYAFDTQTGEQRWKYHTRYGVRTSPALADGRIYFTSGEFRVYGLDAQSGELLWQFDTEGNISGSPVVANGIVYVGDTDDYFYALDAVSGRCRLRFDMYGGTVSTAAVRGTTVYIPNRKGSLFAVDGYAKNWLNEHNMRYFLLKFYLQSLSIVPPLWLIPPNQSGYLWGVNLGGLVYSSPVLLNDRLFIGAGRRLVAVDTESRRIDWEFTTGSMVASSPAMAAGAIFIASRDGNLYAVTADTGSEIWRFTTGDAITSSPVVVDGVVFIGSHDGKVYAIE
ncbi:MAG: PQQ-binding-like beta-propeller repeat protein [Spirochaetales bacterium]|nr:PQQ-binding-like beta-propeller repeat protein [Spirochaetales bacterium]